MKRVAAPGVLALSAVLSLGTALAQAKSASQWLIITAGVQIGIQQAMEKAQIVAPGQVMEIELEEGRKGAAPYYKVMLVNADKELVRLRVNAKTGDAAIDEKEGRVESQYLERLAAAQISLAEAVDAAMAARPGKPLEARLDPDWGKARYQIKLLQADQVVMKVRVDPVSGAVIGSGKD
ncbi:MAG: PepSY domain-containing protein [Comamonas sp.]|uniref:PepSY domain-containing protein n=1 Tax=Comamonas sp. TaxID=34028 RepID=UPI00281FA4DE|nr:PepSY domain-containing protein [Comamonas sp.]MDR0216985.1 PepSY domain-containing protein [Comamonas sp.]